jgi:hypothetical protein
MSAYLTEKYRTEGLTDLRYLFLRGRSWFVRVVVPPRLRPILRKPEIVRALGARDRAKAQELRWAIVAAIHTSLERLRNGRGDTGQLIAQALKDRREAAAAAARSDEAAYDAVRDAWSAHRDELLEDDGEGDYRLRNKSDGKEYRRRDNLYALATGGNPSVELIFHLFQLDAQFLGLKPKTRLDYNSAANLLVKHLGDVTAMNVTAQDAANFADELLKNKAPKTTAKYVSALSGLWKWARRKGFVGETNPLAGGDERKAAHGQRSAGLHGR